jgi:AraC family transcriptional regulator of adaptative response / DNA-3-methyladenine glycosylase II
MVASDNGETSASGFWQNGRMILDRDACYRALQARDARFDGRFFVAVRTTKIYCRPICPARTPHLENIVFYASAAAAQEAGFRPCLRCRPECSPQLGAWRGTASSVTRALALIAEGALDGDDASVGRLALRLGLGERQLRRLFQTHLGASPIAVAQTRRVLFAKQLIHETSMKMSDVAFAAGFGSLRRFNDTFRRMYARPPSVLRRQHTRVRARLDAASARTSSVITLTLSYAAPYDWPAMIAFLAARAVSGMEAVDGDCYRRTLEVDGAHGAIAVQPLAGRHALAVTIRCDSVAALPAIVARIRRVFDLGADVGAINAHLAEDADLAPLVAARPGLRVPGAWDGFELAVRAILGQQITVVAARQLAGKLVAAYGEPLTVTGDGCAMGLTRVFPGPARLAHANLTTLGMPRSRAAALSSLARAAAADAKLFDPDDDLDAAVARLRALPGIGEWTAQYIAMRALREADAFPAADIGLLRAAAVDGVRPTPAALVARAEAWRPWRAYAAAHLWNAERKPTAEVAPARRAIA